MGHMPIDRYGDVVDGALRRATGSITSWIALLCQRRIIHRRTLWARCPVPAVGKLVVFELDGAGAVLYCNGGN